MPRVISRVLGGIRALLHRDRVEHDLDEELGAYLDAAVERHMQAGLSRDAAMRAARSSSAAPTAVKDHVRDAGWESRLDDLWQDARYALRTLRQAPGFTAVAVLTLALAIGANTAIFSIVNGLLLRALPVAAPEQLRGRLDEQRDRGRLSGWLQLPGVGTDPRAVQAALADAVAWTVFPTRLDLAQGGESDLVDGLFVSGNFFDELGVVPPVGRTFAASEDRLARPDSRVAVISHGLWQRRFGGDAAVIGRSLLIERQPVTVIGVTPPEFYGPEVGRAFDVAMPLGSAPLILNEDELGHTRRPFVSRRHAATGLRSVDRIRHRRCYEASIGRSSPRRWRRSRSGVSTKTHN